MCLETCYFEPSYNKKEYFDTALNIIIGMSHIIAHIFHTRNISSTRLPQDVCICTLFQFPTRKREEEEKRSKTSR